MKIKLVKTLLILMLIPLTAKAQKFSLSAEVQPGLSYASIDNDAYNSYELKPQFSFRYGLGISWYFTESLGINTGLMLMRSSYSVLERELTINDSLLFLQPDNINPEYTSYQTQLYYTSIPLRLACHLQKEKIQFVLAAGATYHTYLGSNDYSLKRRYPWYKKNYFSASAGAEIIYPLTEMISVSAGLILDIPLANFLEEDDGVLVLNQSSRLWQFYIPVKLNINF